MSKHITPSSPDLENSPPTTADTLGRHMSLLSGTALITGFVIGTGIFASPGEIMKETSSVGTSLVFWVLGGVFAALGAMSYAELGALFPKSGADHVYLSEAFHPILGLGFSFTNVLIMLPVIEAAMASVFGQYVGMLIQYDSAEPDRMEVSGAWTARIIGMAGITAVGILNMVHKRAGMRIQVVFTAAKLFALVLIIILGLVWIGKGNVAVFQDSFRTTTTEPMKLANGFIFAIFTYAGFHNLNTTAGELKNPKRNLPLAIIISLSVTTTLYVLANVAYFSILGEAQVTNSQVVAMLLGKEVFGNFGLYLMGVFIALSAFGAQNGCAFGHSRLILAASEGPDRWMFRLFGRLSSQGTPVAALCLNIVLSCFFLAVFENFKVLGFIVSFTATNYYGLASAAVIRLRYQRPELERSFRVPLVIPFIFAIVAAGINILTLFNVPDAITWIGVTVSLLCGFVFPFAIYHYIGRVKERAEKGTVGQPPTPETSDYQAN